ncbi:MAG: serine hydroxymethyltransferase [Alphaproteobacteria bacterium]
MISNSPFDFEVFNAIKDEENRQNNTIDLIASENIVSKEVLEAQGSVLTNKYAEGYPRKRYYQGCQTIDVFEELAINRAKELFNCDFANVQPHSGSQANQAVFLALLNPGNCVMGLSLQSGGHLTHGSGVNLSGAWFKAVAYDVNPTTYLLDYDEIESLAKKYKPRLIIAGASAYPRKIDFKRFREIADSVGAYLLADIAHFAGLIVSDLYPSPFPYAHVVTSTTHKTLRGPRGGLILTNDEDLAKRIDKAIFPGIQGGPLMHTIAAKAVAFKEALAYSFKEYSRNMLDNAHMLSKVFTDNGFDVITGGTDSHIVLLNVGDITGKIAANLLEKAHIVCNKNTVPFDTKSPFVTSGVRLGSPSATTRGLGVKEFEEIGCIICDLLNDYRFNKTGENVEATKEKVISICQKFPTLLI